MNTLKKIYFDPNFIAMLSSIVSLNFAAAFTASSKGIDLVIAAISLCLATLVLVRAYKKNLGRMGLFAFVLPASIIHLLEFFKIGYTGILTYVFSAALVASLIYIAIKASRRSEIFIKTVGFNDSESRPSMPTRIFVFIIWNVFFVVSLHILSKPTIVEAISYTTAFALTYILLAFSMARFLNLRERTSS